MPDDVAAVAPAVPTVDTAQPPSRQLRWTMLIGLVAAVAAYLRVPPGLRDNLYAEDGVLFVGDWAWRAHLGLLWEPYAGYQHLLPRLGSGLVVATMPVASWGYAVTAVACLLVGAVAAAVFAFSAGLVSFWPARVLLALIVVLIPIAGVEALGNLANLHWFVLILVPWALLTEPRARWGVGAVAVTVLLATLTEPMCIIFAPLALWRFITAPRRRAVMLAWAVGVAAQVVTTLLSPRPRTPGRPPWMSVILGYVRDVGMSMVTSRPRPLGLAITGVGWWIGVAWVLGLLTFAAIAARFADRHVRVLLAALVLGSIASWSAAFITNNAAAFYFSVLPASEILTAPLLRWATAASAMLAATVPIAVSVLVARFPRLRPAGWAVLGVMLAVMLVNAVPREAREFGTWSSQIDEDIIACRSTAVDMQVFTAPDNWVLGIPCAYAPDR